MDVLIIRTAIVRVTRCSSAVQHVVNVVEYRYDLVVRSVVEYYDRVSNVVGADALLSQRDTSDIALSACSLGIVDCNEYAILIEAVGSYAASVSNACAALYYAVGTNDSSVNANASNLHVVNIVAVQRVGDNLASVGVASRVGLILNQGLSALVGPNVVSSLLLAVLGYGVTVTGSDKHTWCRW